MAHKDLDIKAFLFDFDGTLTKPGGLDFSIIRSTIGCPEKIPVLEFIRGIQNAGDRERALSELDRFETESAKSAFPNLDAEWIIRYLAERQVPMGIISRNRLKSILISLENFNDTSPSDFAVIISRDNSIEPKPSPEGIYCAVEKLGVPVEKTAVVGDFIFDIEAGRAAGAFTVFLGNKKPSDPCPMLCDMHISRLKELAHIVNRGRVVP
jgi:hydrogenase expression/formation protein HypE